MFAWVPVPVRAAVRLVLFGASDGMFRVPLLAPVEVGENVTCTVQFPPAATACPEQLSLDLANWSAFAPERERVPTVRLVPPVFVTVNV